MGAFRQRIGCGRGLGEREVAKGIADGCASRGAFGAGRRAGGSYGFRPSKAGSDTGVHSFFFSYPPKAWQTLQFVRTHNWSPPPNYKGDRVFQNREGKLPAGGDYREFDIDSCIRGQKRGPERIVVDTKNGRAWYTPDHYNTFIEMQISK